MLCLTVKSPFAWAIVTGLKQQENRSWNTKYRGPILIHTSVNDVTNKAGDIEAPMNEIWPGFIVGAVQITDTHRNAMGEFDWDLRSPIIFPFPIKHSGGHSLFKVPINEITYRPENVVGWMKDYLAKVGE